MWPQGSPRSMRRLDDFARLTTETGTRGTTGSRDRHLWHPRSSEPSRSVLVADLPATDTELGSASSTPTPVTGPPTSTNVGTHGIAEPDHASSSVPVADHTATRTELEHTPATRTELECRLPTQTPPRPRPSTVGERPSAPTTSPNPVTGRNPNADRHPPQPHLGEPRSPGWANLTVTRGRTSAGSGAAPT